MAYLHSYYYEFSHILNILGKRRCIYTTLSYGSYGVVVSTSTLNNREPLERF